MIYRAYLYSLFATSKNPKRVLPLRAAIFGLLLVVLGLLSYRLAPHGWQLGNSMPQLCLLIFLFTVLFNNLIFMLLGSFITGGLMRTLSVVQILPLKVGQLRVCYFLAFLPLLLLACALMLPGLAHFFASSLASFKLAYVLLVSQVTTLAYSVIVWSAKGRLGAQLNNLTCLGLAALASNWLLTGRNAQYAMGVAVLLAMVHLVGVVVLANRNLSNLAYKKHWLVVQADRLSISSALRTRYLRSGRSVGALLLVLITLFTLSLLSAITKTLPFAAVAAATILLAGTLSLEIRALSSRHYVLETVFYAQFKQWLAANLLLSGSLVVVVAILVLAVMLQWFPGQVGITTVHFIHLAACLFVCGFAASALLVPLKGDILAQIGSAVIYAVLAWATLRLFSIYQDQIIWLAAVEVLSLIVLSYAAERHRWLTTVRSRHVFRKQQIKV